MKELKQTRTGEYFGYAQKFLLDIGAIYPSDLGKDIFYNNNIDKERIYQIAILNHKTYKAENIKKFLKEIDNILSRAKQDTLFEKY